MWNFEILSKKIEILNQREKSILEKSCFPKMSGTILNIHFKYLFIFIDFRKCIVQRSAFDGDQNPPTLISIGHVLTKLIFWRRERRMNEDMSLRKKDLKTFSHFDERSTSQWGLLTNHKDNKTLYVLRCQYYSLW